MTGLVIFGCFVLAVLVCWASLCGDVLLEEARRAFIRWENSWNHPESQPWPGEPDTRWGPRWGWLCDLADRLTGGACHD